MMRAHSYKSGEILANIGTVEMGVFQGLVGLLGRHMLKGGETVVDCLFTARAHHPEDGTINQSINHIIGLVMNQSH